MAVLLLHCVPFLADGCPEEISVIPSNSSRELDIELHWSEQPFGALSEIQCPCNGAALSQTTSRRCVGSLSSSVQWEKLENSACPFSDVMRRLCLLPGVSQQPWRLLKYIQQGWLRKV